MNEPSFNFIKTDIFNFPVCKIYLGTWARGHVGHVEHVGHVGDVGTLGSHLADLFANGSFWKEHSAKNNYSLELFPKHITICLTPWFDRDVNTVELLNIPGF